MRSEWERRTNFMNDEIQEIDRLMKQSLELSDTLIRLARKLQEQIQRTAQVNPEQADNLPMLHAKLNDLRSRIDVVKREIGPQRYYDWAYAKARQPLAEQASTAQEAVIELLRDGVADKTMAPGQAVEEVVKLLRTDLPASRKIAIREAAKTAFETGDDILDKIRPFLKNASPEQQRKVNKQVFNNAPGQCM
jgi:hypothetical protein